MNLTKWSSSCKELAQRLHETQGVHVKHNGMTKVLGISWNLDTDELQISLGLPEFGLNENLTKRIILAYTQKYLTPWDLRYLL